MRGKSRTLLLPVILSSFCSFWTAMTLALQMPSSKVTVTDDGSSNSGFWGRSPQPPEANGGLRALPPTLRRFFVFFQQIKAFFCIFWSKFRLKSMLLNDCRVCCWCVLKVYAQNTGTAFSKKKRIFKLILV